MNQQPEWYRNDLQADSLDSKVQGHESQMAYDLAAKSGSVYDLIAKILPESGPVYDLTAIDRPRERPSTIHTDYSRCSSGGRGLTSASIS
jgi:hypothetical protein